MRDEALLDLVGRTLMIGFEGSRFDADLEKLLSEVRPGGIILFKRNVGGPEVVAGLTSACQDLARSEFGRPLLVAIDQEGGPVKRLGAPFSVYPSQREVAAGFSASEAKAMAAQSGRELAAVGINFNLAPVLDLARDPDSDIMVERCFGDDPERAAEYGRAVVKGHGRHGVLTCAKHFPGIGDVRIDPHQDLPTVVHGEERLRSVELRPFAKAVEFGIPGVMTAHVNYPALDPDWPGTFSEKILTGLLRGELGHKGLILTDDLEMGAVVRHFSIGPAAVRTFKAGSDLLLVCRRPELVLEARNALAEAVRSGEISEGRIEESVQRLATASAEVPNPGPTAYKEVFESVGQA